MKIFVTGTRGIPNIPGGVEKHCQELYPLIVSHGHEVILATRTQYITSHRPDWNNVHLCHMYAPQKKSLEAIIHTFLAVCKARFMNVDIIHIHAVGPSLMVPLAKIFRLKVVVTNHGPDYNRSKWGNSAKIMLKIGEYLGGTFADEVIVLSADIADIIKKRCKRDSHLIYNGVPLPNKSSQTNFLKKLNIKPRNYLLAVARFVPEKGLHDLLIAFKKFTGDYQLVLAGDADYETTYSRTLKQHADQDKRVILTGYIGEENLNQVFSHARLFVLPSYHEGLPIALLEAMSYDLPVLVSDIPANNAVELPKERYFHCGDIQELKRKIELLVDNGLSEQEQQEYQLQISKKYNWSKIAKKTIEVYQKALS